MVVPNLRLFPCFCLLLLSCSGPSAADEGEVGDGDEAGGGTGQSSGGSIDAVGGGLIAGTGGGVGSGGVSSGGTSGGQGNVSTGGQSTDSGGSQNGADGGTDAGAGGSPPADPSCGTHKWACWPMPNPATSGLPQPASYTQVGDGTVIDEVTGLVWEASPPSTDGTWDDALGYCEALSLGGYDDWRLPTRIEMTSVLDYSRPGWSAEAFSAAPGGFHRTSSDWILTINQQGAGAGKDFAWAFNMSDGIVSNAYSKVSAARYRCVRSDGEGEAPSEAAREPENHYAAVATGEVRDNYTGLIWQAAESGAVDHAGALSYCASLDLGGSFWRLPSLRELSTLVDEAKVAPSINEEFFPGTKYGSRSNNWYWASDEDALSTAAWALNFDDGFTGTNKGAEGAWNYFTSGFARCVR